MHHRAPRCRLAMGLNGRGGLALQVAVSVTLIVVTVHAAKQSDTLGWCTNAASLTRRVCKMYEPSSAACRVAQNAHRARCGGKSPKGSTRPRPPRESTEAFYGHELEELCGQMGSAEATETRPSPNLQRLLSPAGPSAVRRSGEPTDAPGSPTFDSGKINTPSTMPRDFRLGFHAGVQHCSALSKNSVGRDTLSSKDAVTPSGAKITIQSPNPGSAKCDLSMKSDSILNKQNGCLLVTPWNASDPLGSWAGYYSRKAVGEPHLVGGRRIGNEYVCKSRGIAPGQQCAQWTIQRQGYKMYDGKYYIPGQCQQQNEQEHKSCSCTDGVYEYNPVTTTTMIESINVRSPCELILH